MPIDEAVPPTGRCGAKTRGGGTCTQYPIRGTKRCRMHTGRPGRAGAKAKGQVVVELARWGLGDTTVDPGEVLLRLVTQSAERVGRYSRLLGEAYEAGERLREASEATARDANAVGADQLTAVQDLRRILTTGGVAALIGFKYDATKDGDIYPAEEALRGLARLEAEERDRCASFAQKAVAAGLAERQVRVAERQGIEMAAVFRRVLDAVLAALFSRLVEVLGLSEEQQALVPELQRYVAGLVPQLLQQEIAAITGGRIIEGGAA